MDLDELRKATPINVSLNELIKETKERLEAVQEKEIVDYKYYNNIFNYLSRVKGIQDIRKNHKLQDIKFAPEMIEREKINDEKVKDFISKLKNAKYVHLEY